MVLNSLDVVRLDNFAWLVLYSDLFAIKMGEHKIDTCQSFSQADFFL
jgi:hypothetical protein